MTTLLINGRMHSPAMPDATAMAVRDGIVVWLGSDDVGRQQFPDAQVVDLDGGFVAPAFVDSHVHLTATGLTLAGLDLRAATSLRHCLELIAEYARTHPDGPIWGHGWDESGWPEHTAPSTDDLDSVVGDRPAYLARVDVHSAAASTALRRLAPGLADAAGFDPQRPLTADAHHLVRAAARDRLTRDQRAHARLAALDLAAANGIVAVHECAGPDIGGLDDWHELRDTDHGVEIVGYWGEAVTTAEQAASWSRRPVPAGWPATCSSTAPSARARRGCTSRTPTRPTAAATPTSTRRPSPRICTPAPKRASRRVST